MATPFKRPRIEYKPQLGGNTPAPEESRGDEGRRPTLQSTTAVINSLRFELRDAREEVFAAMKDYAVTDKTGDIMISAAKALGTETLPKSISLRTYAALGSTNGGFDAKKAFEEKSLSVWGDAGVMALSALDAVNMEASRAKAFLSERPTDESVLDAISNWGGAARLFVVDCKRAATMKRSKSMVEEIEQYAEQAVDVQKSSVLGASQTASDVQSSLKKITGLYGQSSSSYNDMFDSVIEPDVVTSGPVSKVVEKQIDKVAKYKDDRVEDMEYRADVFKESGQKFISSVVQLRLTQFLNRGLSRAGGVSESDVDTVTVTNPDASFDSLSFDKTAEDTYVREDGTSALDDAIAADEANLLIGDAIDEIEFGGEDETSWHSKVLHDELEIEAADSDKLGGVLPSGYSAAGHDHNAAYADIDDGVTDGDTHDHTGGSGAQIDHGSQAGLGDADHEQYITGEDDGVLIQSGRVWVDIETDTLINQRVSTSVTFDTAFSSTPHVIVSKETSAPDTFRYVSAHSMSTTGFTGVVYTTTDYNRYFQWIAIGAK